MIKDYANHAANERTFLAWVRTGIAFVALGFVIERFNLFLATVAATVELNAPVKAHVQRLSGPLGRYGGLALICGGVALIALAIIRFFRTEARLSAEDESTAKSVARTEFLMMMASIAAVAIFSGYIALG
jgi:putative membrane protein